VHSVKINHILVKVDLVKFQSRSALLNLVESRRLSLIRSGPTQLNSKKFCTKSFQMCFKIIIELFTLFETFFS